MTFGKENAMEYWKTVTLKDGRACLLRNGTEDIPLLGGLTECEANKTEQFSIMIDIERPDIAVGDSVTVKYDGKELCKIRITEL